MRDTRPSLDVAFGVFGLPATLALSGEGQLPHEAEVAVTVVWLPAPSTSLPPGVDVSAVEPRNRLAFRRSEVPMLHQGSLVKVPAVGGGPIKTWRVDVIEESSAEEVRVLVLPVEPQFP